MHNHLPGTGILHRTDLLVDLLKEYEINKENNHCYRVSRFFPKSFRLYNENECKDFFQMIDTAVFKKQMKTKILYTF